jgi:hypothetical protein
MGWCGGTIVFDKVCDILIGENPVTDKKQFLRHLISELEDMDWDCESDSNYWENPLVREVFKELHPNWFEEDEE